MLESAQAFMAEISSQPAWLRIWMNWLGAVNFAALLFLSRKEARWVLAAMLANLVVMTGLYSVVGYERILGIVHVLFWTPLLVWLWRSGAVREAEGWFGTWLRALFATNAVSLVIDYVDVARYLLGERSG